MKEEREKVIEILLNKNCIPVGMEYFPAANGEQMTIIKQLIDECDYYILILGAKYGSVDPISNKSFTQLEYEYAIEKGIPISAFYVENIDDLPNIKVEQKHKQELDGFVNMVKSQKMCKSWKNADDLAGKVSTSLDYQIKNYPRTGWAKADKILTEEVSNTLIKLTEENKKLKEQIDFLSSSIPKGTECYMQGDDSFTLHYYITTNPWSSGEQGQNKSVIKTWNEIFLAVSTILLKPVVESVIFKHIEKMLLPDSAIMDSDDFQTIIIQLMALKLITTDIVKIENEGAYPYWFLSPYGRMEMVRLKALKK